MNPTDDDLKKLLVHSVLQLNIDGGSKERPMSIKEEKALLAKFADKDFPDSFNLSIIKEKSQPGRLFSQSALERFLLTLRLYLGGRILGQFEKTQKPPEVFHVRIEVQHLTKEQHEKLMQDLTELGQ